MTVAQLVARERTRLGAALLARGAAAALAGVAVAIAVGTVALGNARWITRPGAPLFAWSVALVLAGVALWWTRRAVRRAADPAAVAREIERERALRAGALRGALEVGGSGALGARASQIIASRLTASEGPLAPELHRRARRGGIIAIGAAAAALVLLGAARAASPDGWRAVRHPVGALTGSILPPLRIANAPRFLMRGEKLRLSVLAPERRAIALHVRATGAPWDTLDLPVAGGTATTVLGPLDADLTVVATDGRATSDTTIIHVTDRPFVGDVAIRATYPRYLDRPAETIPVGEPARVPRGTVLAISGRASTALARVGLARERDTLHLEPDGQTFAGTFTASESGRWLWYAAGGQGPIADLPQPLELEVVPDSAPRVEILQPQRDTAVLATAQVTLGIAATDDHGISTIMLRSWRRLADGRAMPEVAQPLAAPKAPQWSGTQAIDLSPRELQPGDELHVVVAATDDSPWRQTATSRELVLRVPTMSEQRQQARALADSTVSRLESAARSERELAQRTDEAARSRADRVSTTSSQSLDKPAADPREHGASYQSAEEAKALAQRQQQLQEQVRQAQRDAKELEQRLRAAGVMDSALTQRLRDVQQLLRDALTPELQRQLDEVMRATRQLSPEDMRRAMQNLAERQQHLREQLERSAEMLRRAALEGSMQTLRDEARDIAQAERKMADSLSRGARGADSAARGAQELSRRSQQLSKDVSELSKRLQQEKAQAGPQKLAGASQRADSSARAMQRVAPRSRPQPEELARQPEDSARQPGDSMRPQEQTADRQSGEQPTDQQREQQRAQQQGQQQAQQQGQQQGERQGQQQQPRQQGRQQAGAQQGGEPQPGREGERQGAGEREGAPQPGAPDRAQRAGAAQEGARQMEQAAKQLGDARDSQIQEWKHEVTSELDQSIQETMQLARAQQSLADRARQGRDQGLRADQSAVQQGVQKVQERLQRAARQSAHVSPQSQGAMAEASRQVSSATQRAADGGAQSSSQTAQAMDDAAQSLNRAAAQMMRDRARAAGAQSASGFSEMIEQMRQAAKEQGSINAQASGLVPMPGGQPSAQSMAQVRQLAKRQRGVADKLDDASGGEGQAGQLAKEMRQIADVLDRGRLDPSVLDRQQRLYHKLLDAGLTLEKDEREDTGERESQTATTTETITPGTQASGRAAVRWREPTWSELRGLTADERRAVLEYFKRINAQQP
ncbi:MAG TPA: hypothetical protein VFS05_04850 [Gemmatimonadaceae bacterium]|nr:hypothetical protein [Gemmatimonadaceae bacterium]